MNFADPSRLLAGGLLLALAAGAIVLFSTRSASQPTPAARTARAHSPPDPTPAAPAPTGQATTPAVTPAPREQAAGPADPAQTAPAPWAVEISDSAELKGRLGRLTVQHPDGAHDTHDVKVFEPAGNQYLVSGTGPYSTELLPGKYDVQISGMRMPGISIEPRRQTTIHVGVLRVQAGGGTEWRIYVPASQEYLISARGQGDVALPPGEYQLQVGGARESIKIEPGKITEF